jgi:molecular chaperone GrpE (heat shock protein)
MWNIFWEWTINHHIYNAVVILSVIIIITNFLAKISETGWVQRFLNKYKNIEIGKGGIKLERKDEGYSEKDKQQDNALISIKDELENINNRLDRQYQYIKETALKSCIGVIWSENVPIVEFLDAAFLYLKLDGNGNTIRRVVKMVMKHDAVETYRSELSKFRKENENLSKHFSDSITEINKELY